MKKNSLSTSSPLVDQNQNINNPLDKSELFNNYFSSKSQVSGDNDPNPCTGQN